MDSYLEIRLRPDPEFGEHQLLAALFAKLHRRLSGLGCTDVGVSFPDFRERPAQLGARLRLHSSAHGLQAVMRDSWLSGMQQLVQLSAIAGVPAESRHRRLLRVQAKSSPERLRRRLMKRHQLTAEEALARIPDSAAERLNHPYIELTSSSTGQRFRLYLVLGPLLDQATAGPFNAYGLSQSATVPWF